jgi:predicted CopG family antitoxin
MATTIQISDTTKQLLSKIKDQEHATSYDEVILHLVKKKSKVPESMFGAAKGMTWKKEDRMEFKEW